MNKYLCFVYLILPYFLFSQNTLEGAFSPQEDYHFNLLYHLTPSGMVYDLGAQSKGEGVYRFELDSTRKAGMYKLIYATPMEENFFYFVYDGTTDLTFTFDKEKGAQFKDTQNQLLSKYLTKRSAFNNAMSFYLQEGDSKKRLTEFHQLVEKQIATQAAFEKEAQGMMIAKYIKALNEGLPTKFSSIAQFSEQYKTHIFSNFDFDDLDLQATQFPALLLEEYYQKMVVDSKYLTGEEAAQHVIDVLKEGTPFFQRKLLVDYWDGMRKSDELPAASVLADYLIPLSKELNDENLTTKLKKFKRLSVGVLAPNFALLNEDGSGPDSLRDLEGSTYYVLAFWNSRCSHCLVQMPELNFELSSFSKERLTAVGIGLERDSVSWKEEIEVLPNFVHTMVTEEERVKVSFDYDIKVTPTFFILDKDKKILFKPKGIDDLVEELKKLNL